MIVAVASDGLDVCRTEPSCASFMCYTVDRGRIVSCQNLPNFHLPDANTAQILSDLGVSVLVVGDIDPAARRTLEVSGVEVVDGASGSAKEAAESLVAELMRGTSPLDDPAFAVEG